MGADPTIRSSDGDTPLHWLAAFDGYEACSVAQVLIDAGTNLDAAAKPVLFEFAPLCNYEADTPLHRAVGKGDLGAVQALLACGASATSAGNREDRTTPIALAARFHYAEILDMLLKSLQDPLAASHPHAGVSLLAICISGDLIYGERFSKMARHGRLWWEEVRSTLDVIRRWGGETHMRGFPRGMACAGTTPMLLASAYNLPEIVQYLLDHGCRPNVNVSSPHWLDGGRYTPIIKSVFQRARGVFKLLLDNGADATQLYVDEDWHDLPPLYVCAVAGHDDPYFAERLLAQGAAINGFESPEGLFETPFACALRSRCFALAKWLLDHGANPHIEYQKGLMLELEHASSVLGFLIRQQPRSSLACIDFLLREVPDVSFTVSSDRQYSVLHVLAMKTQGAAEDKGTQAAALVFQTICAHFKPSTDQMNQRICEGRTAAWMAVAMANVYVAEQLLRGGADPRILDAQGVHGIDLNINLMESTDNNHSHADCGPRVIEIQVGHNLKVREALGKLLQLYRA
jgi:ankyrin repeat protein